MPGVCYVTLQLCREGGGEKKKKERRRSPPDKVGAFASAGDAAADKRCFPPSVRCSPKPRAVMLSDSGGI